MERLKQTPAEELAMLEFLLNNVGPSSETPTCRQIDVAVKQTIEYEARIAELKKGLLK